MPFPIVAALGALGAIGSSAINASTARRNTDLTNAANLEVAKYQANYDREQWQAMNRYNLPSAQMERIKAAGLNPHLIYGSGSVTGNATSQFPKYNAPALSYNYLPAFDPGSAFQAYQDASVKNAQTDNLKAQTNNVNARTAVEFVRKSNYLTDGEKKKIELEVADELKETHIEQDKQKLEVLKQTLTNKQKMEIYQDLKNEFQRNRNKWEKLGITPKDALWIRGATKIIGGLGFNFDWMTDLFKGSGSRVSKWLNDNL